MHKTPAYAAPALPLFDAGSKPYSKEGFVDRIRQA
jgi:hypothetical protein